MQPDNETPQIQKTAIGPIKDGDIFRPEAHDDVVRELDKIHNTLYLIPGNHKADIIISYFKDRSIKTSYLTTNRRVVEKVRSGSLSAYYIGELFAWCRGNVAFLNSFEQFIQKVFHPDPVDGRSPDEKWTDQVSKMKIKFTFLRDQDFRFDYGKKDVMLNSLQAKLGKDRQELNEMLGDM